jgi:hypothetical protein
MVEAAACSLAGAVAGADASDGVADATGFVVLPLINAQPPNVAANDVAVSNSLTPGALVAGFLEDLVDAIVIDSL